MQLLIFGATGGTGRELVRQALEQGHSVTAFARDPSTLGARDGMTTVAGDVRDASAVERAVAGHDAVLCAVGRPAMKAGNVRSKGTRTIVQAMEQAGVRRLVCLSTLGTGETRSTLPPLYRYALVPLLLRTTFTEHERQEAVVRASRLDWTIVRAGALTDDERTGTYRHGRASTLGPIKFKISRADVAGFALRLAADGAYRRESPGLSY
jgi:putative NADH-flavin reductase